MRRYCTVIALAIIVSIGVAENQMPKKVFVKQPKCPSSGSDRLPHPNKCTQYYICQDGKGEIHECPEGLHFNVAIKQCDWPSAGCLVGSRPETQPNIPDSEEADMSYCIGTCPLPDPMDKTIHLPYSGDCNKFCKCSNGVPYIMNCPANLHFDTKWEVCNWPWAANCQWKR